MNLDISWIFLWGKKRFIEHGNWKSKVPQIEDENSKMENEQHC